MPKIAVLVPCYNEEKTVAQVVRDFAAELPDAKIYVYDNNSSDRTGEIALAAGATVRRERRQGKGYVIRSMFKEVDADVYVMVDGDGTYPPHRVHDLIAPVLAGEADMVSGSRLHEGSDSSFRQLNLWGNRFFISVLNLVFQVQLTDLLSGYRAFNRSVVKGLPLMSRGFEIETELTMKAIERDLRIVEIPVDLTDRPEGSSSKIKIAKDGVLILYTLLSLFRDYKPFTLFGSLGIVIALAGLVPGTVVVREFILTGYIERIPSAILAVGLVLSGLLILLVGLVLHAVARRFQEHDRQMQNLMEQLLRK